MKKIDAMITAFRDGFQSVFGARVLTPDFLPALEAAVDAGITHFEAGGGARFQALYFYCNEDAFEMMDTFREKTGPEANLQTLARGINVVGLDSQSSDIIDLHAKMFKKHGISTIRNFDALNDVNNLIYSGRCITEAGLNHELCVTMMELPPGVTGAHTAEFYIQVLKNILDADIPFTSICFKDASGTSIPSTVHDTIKEARKILGEKTVITFHTHDTAGTGMCCYTAAMEAGVDRLDCSLAPVSGGTGQPDLITLWHTMRGTDFSLDIDIKKIIEVERIFKECMSDYFIPPEAKAVEPLIPFSPMPGGALTANTQMMRDSGILHRYAEVADAMGEVVVKGGFGTSVTPVSQFYFQQAFNNVMMGPWKKIAEGYGKMVLGYFGKTPVEPDPEVVKLAHEQLGLEPTTRVPLEINDQDPQKGIEPAKKMLEAEGLPITDENIFIAATCKEKGITFLKGEATVNVRKISKDREPEPAPKKAEIPTTFTVTVDDSNYSVEIENGYAVVDGKRYKVDVKEGAQAEKAKPRPSERPTGPDYDEQTEEEEKTAVSQAAEKGREEIRAPLPGTVVRILTRAGSTVKEGEVILVIESMKMETDITAPVSGTIEDIPIKQNDSVQTGDLVASIITGSMKMAELPEQPTKRPKTSKPRTTVPPQPEQGRTGKPSPVRPAGSKTPSRRTQKIKETTVPKGEQEEIKAPLPGLVVRIVANPGDRVNRDDVILVIESMKMETEITSPVSGTVESIKTSNNDHVNTGDLLAVINT